MRKINIYKSTIITLGIANMFVIVYNIGIYMQKQKTDLPQIKQDLHGVETRRRQFTETEEKLNDYTASVEEAIEWYYSQDPLKEQRMVDVLSSTKEHSFYGVFESDLDALRQSELYDRAAAILIGNLSHPQIIGVENVDQSQASTVIDSVNHISNVNQLLDDVIDKQLDKKGITQLAIAGDMLVEASRFTSYSGLAASVPFVRKELEKNGIPYVDNYFEINKMYSQHGYMAYTLAAVKALENLSISEIAEQGVDSKTVELGIKMAVRACSVHFNNEPNTRSALKNEIEPLTRLLTDVLKNGVLDSIDSSVLKGDWHEVSWFVDYCMYSQISGRDGYITPSASFEDCPHSNYPKYNRGFDYWVGTMQARRAVQLKSSPRAAKKSQPHPLIVTAVENDFSIEPAELIEKFECYRRYIKFNFNPSMRQEVESHILPSVKTISDEISELEKAGDKSTMHSINQLHDLGLPLPTLNRAMRRARDKRHKR